MIGILTQEVSSGDGGGGGGQTDKGYLKKL